MQLWQERLDLCRALHEVKRAATQREEDHWSAGYAQHVAHEKAAQQRREDRECETAAESPYSFMSSDEIDEMVAHQKGECNCWK